VTLESLLHPYTLIFLVSFVLSMIGPHFGGRRKMMAFKFCADTLGAIYLFLLGGISGACAAQIAGTGALIQALTPHQHLKKTVWLRMGIALALSVISIYVSYRTPLDLLPITMVIICRFGELQSQAQRIRLVYFVTCFPWIIYHMTNGYYLPMAACIAASISLLLSLLRHNRTQHPAVPQEI